MCWIFSCSPMTGEFGDADPFPHGVTGPLRCWTMWPVVRTPGNCWSWRNLTPEALIKLVLDQKLLQLWMAAFGILNILTDCQKIWSSPTWSLSRSGYAGYVTTLEDIMACAVDRAPRGNSCRRTEEYIYICIYIYILYYIILHYIMLHYIILKYIILY